MSDRDFVLGVLVGVRASVEAAIRALTPDEERQTSSTEPIAPEHPEVCSHPERARKTLTTMGVSVDICMACGTQLTDPVSVT